MAVYVDPAIWERWDRLWCHLLADSPDELHIFAAELGLRRARFQSKPGRAWVDHYDIGEDRRRAAVALGAIEITWRRRGRADRAQARSGARRAPARSRLDRVADRHEPAPEHLVVGTERHRFSPPRTPAA